MKMDKKTRLAYAAGIVDGEGCIRISKRNPRNGRSTSYNISVSVVQKDGRIIDWLYGNFGGLVYLMHKQGNWIYEWRICELKAFGFLKEIFPFIIYKKSQVELGIRFHQRRVYERVKRNNRQQFTSLSQHELEEREKIYQQMSELKKVFQKSKNPNVVEYTLKSMVQV